MEHIPTVDTCCGCLELELAARAIGTVETVSSFIAVCHDFYIATVDKDEINAKKSGLVISSFLLDLLVSSIEAVLGPSLLMGVNKRNGSWVRIWLVVHICLYFLALCSYLATIVLLPCCSVMRNVSLFEKLMTLYSFRNFVLYGYCIIVVNSYYAKILHDFQDLPDSETGLHDGVRLPLSEEGQ